MRTNKRKCAPSLRGQVWSMDLTIGLLALAFIIMLFMLTWDNLLMRWGSASEHTQMEASAFFAAESLLATPGEPESWEMLPHIDEDVSAIGLANGRNELNRMKIEKLVSENSTSYTTIKNRLGLQRYEFGMQITSLTGEVTYYEFGRFSGGALKKSLTFERIGILDGEPVMLHMEVWGK
jgi:hypothetical protein